MTDNAQPNDGWTIDPNAKMRDFREFMRVSQSTTSGGDTSELYPCLAKFVKAWPYSPLDPAVPKSYDELTITQFREVVERVSAAFQGFAGGGK